MDDRLLTLTAAALAGIASRPNGGHGVTPREAADLGAEAATLGRAALLALEEAETAPAKPKPRGR